MKNIEEVTCHAEIASVIQDEGKSFEITLQDVDPNICSEVFAHHLEYSDTYAELTDCFHNVPIAKHDVFTEEMVKHLVDDVDADIFANQAVDHVDIQLIVEKLIEAWGLESVVEAVDALAGDDKMVLLRDLSSEEEDDPEDEESEEGDEHDRSN
jgi:hypothetical protein